MDWVRLYHETPTDPKWRVIAKRSAQRIGDVIAVWNFVLCNASSNTEKRGETHNLVTEDIAAALDLNDADVVAILAAMEGKTIKDGTLLAWEKRNPKREDNSTERVKRWRETHRNAEKRPELEEEEDKKKVMSASADQQPLHSEVGTKRAARAAYPESFEQFWKAYPTDRLMSKSKAAAIWAKLDAEDRERAQASVPEFRAFCAKDKTYRVIHAVRYLSERRFDGFAPLMPADPARAAAALDKADKILGRGKYAPELQEAS